MLRLFRTVMPLWLAATLMLIPSACARPNTPPEIVSLASRSRVVSPGDSVLIECVAADVDKGDQLAYEWSCDRGSVNGYDGVVAWTAPEQEGPARIAVTVRDSHGETATQSVAIVVKHNVAPVIEGVTAEREWVPPGEAIVVRCVAEDGDDDVLSYSWTAECGAISGQSDTAVWTAPEVETRCTITVVVDDGYDGRATASVQVVSSIHEPLLVTGMTVTPLDDPPYIVARSDWYKVYWEDSYLIECFVPEPERIVSYEWSDGGATAVFPVGTDRISFDDAPARIRWTAPRAREEFALTVTVRDSGGNVASKTITLYVDTCTCAFPKDGADLPDEADDE